MSELDKNKAGLHKQVSSVFKGVPLPQNNGARQPSDTPAPAQTPAGSPKPASVNQQISKSSLIKKLSESEDTSDSTGKSRSANTFKKPASTKQVPQSTPVSKPPQVREPLKQVELQPEGSVFIEEAGDGLWQQIKDKLFTPAPGESPTKQKAMVIMIPILAIIMIFAFRQVLSKSPHKTEGTEPDDAPVVVSNTNSADEIDWQIPEPIKIVTRDPIQLPTENNTQNVEENSGQSEATNTENHEVFIIKDIVFSKDRPSAVIGSRIVYEGNEINGMTIMKINRDSIEFETKDGQRKIQNVRDGKMVPVLDGTGQSEDKPDPEK